MKLELRTILEVGWAQGDSVLKYEEVKLGQLCDFGFE